jgi:hypothetical protein
MKKVESLYPETEYKFGSIVFHGNVDSAFIEQSKRVHHVPSIDLWKAEHALISPYGVVMEKGLICKPSVYSMFGTWNSYPSFLKKRFLGKIIKDTRPMLVAHHMFWNNYYHWLCECLPRIFAAKQMHKDLVLVLPEQSPSFVLQYLAFFDFKDLVFVPENYLLQTEEVYIPSALPYALHHPQLMLDMVAFLKKRLVNSNLNEHQFFISRAKALYRRSEQENDLFLQYQSKGFQKLFSEQNSVLDQMLQFQHCIGFAGIHGAGMSNLIFMRSGFVHDYMHRLHNDYVFASLAGIFNIHFEVYACEGAKKLGFNNNDDLLLPIV